MPISVQDIAILKKHSQENLSEAASVALYPSLSPAKYRCTREIPTLMLSSLPRHLSGWRPRRTRRCHRSIPPTHAISTPPPTTTFPVFQRWTHQEGRRHWRWQILETHSCHLRHVRCTRCRRLKSLPLFGVSKVLRAAQFATTVE